MGKKVLLFTRLSQKPTEPFCSARMKKRWKWRACLRMHRRCIGIYGMDPAFEEPVFSAVTSGAPLPPGVKPAIEYFQGILFV